MGAYEDFLARKAMVDPMTGIMDDVELPDVMFPFQADIARWALKRGRAAIFAGTGLGKSLMELAWGQAVASHTGMPVLHLAPLAVAPQMVREAAKFGIPCRQVASQDDVGPGINITNYQKLDHFTLAKFGGVILDESSILKSTDGHYRTKLIEECQQVPFRLAATATPAPNDFMELGNHAEFLGVMSYTDMLATFFTHDGGDTAKWRLKGHAENEFWKWMASWSVMIRKPSDLGYEDTGYDLPTLTQVQHTVKIDRPLEDGALFGSMAATMSERIVARRDSVAERVAMAVAMTPAEGPFVWWCNLNSESEEITKAIPGAVETKGSDSDEVKEKKLLDFAEGRTRVLVTKPKVCGFGMNWQHCNQTGFVGLNDSFEQVYQAIRRFWRFGQTRPVTVHMIAAETEGAVVANLRRKEADADRMATSMVAHMSDLSTRAIKGQIRDTRTYAPEKPVTLPSWLQSAV